jgi:hypothetical protein
MLRILLAMANEVIQPTVQDRIKIVSMLIGGDHRTEAAETGTEQVGRRSEVDECCLDAR